MIILFCFALGGGFRLELQAFRLELPLRVVFAGFSVGILKGAGEEEGLVGIPTGPLESLEGPTENPAKSNWSNWSNWIPRGGREEEGPVGLLAGPRGGQDLSWTSWTSWTLQGFQLDP